MDSIAQATIKVVADTSQAERGLAQVNQSLNNLIPGANVATNVISRLTGGIYQLVQGISANAINAITSGMKKFAQAGEETAIALDAASVGLSTVLGEGEDVSALLQDIQKNAVTTPFDIEGLAKGTQQLAMVTKNGAEAERTILNLGKAVAAGGGGTEELERLTANLQEIGLNANITTRDIRQFGTASVPIMEMVAETVGISTDKVTEYLKSVSNPYDVLVEAINRAGEEGGRFADMYTAAAMTMGQVTENLSDSFGIFARNVGEASGILTRIKEAMMGVANSLLDPTVVGTLAESIRKLTENFDLLGIATGAIDKLVQVLGAFNAGQFDNIFVFFRELFDTLKQSSIVQIFSRAFKTIIDLFSDNHTAEEVKNVAHQFGVLLRTLIEFKVIATVGQNISGLVDSVIKLGSAFMTAGQGWISFGSVISAHPVVAVTVAVVALIAALTALGKLDGVKNFFNSLGQSIKNTLSYYGSLAKSLLTAGYNIMVGLWNGLVQGFNGIISKVAEMGRAIVTTFKNALGIHSPSTVMRDEVGKPIDEGIAEGIRKNYGTIIDAEEDVLNELVDLQKDWVDEVSDLGALDLVQQLNVYKDFAALYVQGTKARLEMDEKVHDAEVAITKEIIDLTDDFNTQFKKSVQNAKDFYNVFEYTQGVIARTTASIIEGMNRQNNNMLQYLRNLQKINSMGFDSDFLQEVMDQGMDAAGEVAGLAEATEDEIDEINRLWRERGQIATDIAVENTKELRKETLEQIDYLQSGLDNKIVDVTDTGTLLVDTFTVAIYDGMPKVEDAIEQLAASASSSAKKGTSGIGDAFEDIGEVASAAAGGIDDFTSALDKLNIEAFDTSDLFSFVKNLLGGIPWWAWAGGVALFGGNLLSKVVPAIQTVISKTKPMVSILEKAMDDGSVAVTKTTTTVKNGLTRVVKETYKDWGDMATDMQVSVKETGRGITKITDGIGSDVKKSVSETVTDLERIQFEPTKTAQKAAEQVTKTTEKAGKTATSAVSKAAQSSGDEIKRAGKTAVSSTSDTGNLVYNNTLSTTSKLGNAIRKPFQILNSLLQNVTSVVENVLTSVGRILQKGIKVIINILNEALSGIMKLVNTLFKGLGKAIKSFLKELSDPQLLTGVGVMAALAGTLLILAGALWVFNSVEWESLLKGAVALAGLATAAAIIGHFAGPISLGSAAIAALGAAILVFGAGVGVAVWAITKGLEVAAENLRELSEIATDVQSGPLLAFTGILGQVSIMLSLIAAFTAFGAIGAVCSAVIGEGLLVAARGLAEVADWVGKIDLDAIREFTRLCQQVVEILSEISGWEAFKGALKTVAVDVIAGGLFLAAKGLKSAAETGKEIKQEDLQALGDRCKEAVGIFSEINAWEAFKGVLKAVCTDVISGGLILAAKGLKSAAETGKEISQEGLIALGDRCNEAVAAMKQIGGVDALKGVIKGFATDIISAELIPAASALKTAANHGKEINMNGLILVNNSIHNLVTYIIPNINALGSWDAGKALGKIDDAGKLAEKLVPLSYALANVQDIGDAGKNVANIVLVLRTQLAQLPQVLATFDSAFYQQGQTWAVSLIQGWESENGNFSIMGYRAQTALWEAIESKMPDEFYQGQTLAIRVLEGINAQLPNFNPAGSKVQGEFWRAIENKMPDEYYQGRTLAGKVLEGIYTIQNEGGYYSAGAQVSQGFANGISGTIGRVNAAVGSLSSAAISKLKDLLGIASPSKVFAELGAYVAEGFAEGIEDNLDDVMSTGEALAKAVMEGYNDTITPLAATVERAKFAADTTAPRSGGASGDAYVGASRSVTINQTNNVYDEMDTTKIINDLTWAISRS